MTLAVLTVRLFFLHEEPLLLELGNLCQYYGRSARVVWADEKYWSDESVLGHRQDKVEVAVLSPYEGALDL